MPYITKIEQEAVLPLAKQIAAQPSQIVSKTLVQNRAVSLTLFAFDQGEEIATHDSSGDAMVQIWRAPPNLRWMVKSMYASWRCADHACQKAAFRLCAGSFLKCC